MRIILILLLALSGSLANATQALSLLGFRLGDPEKPALARVESWGYKLHIEHVPPKGRHSYTFKQVIKIPDSPWQRSQYITLNTKTASWSG